MAGLIDRTRRVYRGQAAVLLVSILVPAVANLASLTGVGPGAAVDLTPPSMSVLGVAFAVVALLALVGLAVAISQDL